MRKKLFFILSFILLAGIANSQYEIPRLSQYLINGLVVNPAYAGSRESLSSATVAKYYFAGFEGAPGTYKFGLHSPLKNDKVALGLTVENYNNPSYSNTGAYAHYAYRIWLGGLRLAMGLKAGFFQYKENYDALDLLNSQDPSFTNETGFAPNFGAGLYLYNNKFFAGLSVPYFLNLPDSSRGINFDTRSYHYMLTLGYLYEVSENLKLKPSALIDYSVSGLDVQSGVNFILMDDKLWLGALYRTSSRALTGILEVQLNSWLRIGYAYDHSFTNLSNVSNGTHEIMLRWELNFESNAESPLYF